MQFLETLPSLKEMAQGIRQKNFSVSELVDAYLKKIHHFNPQLNAFITITESQAREAAKEADKLLAKHASSPGNSTSLSPLFGIPIAHKDIFCTQGIKTSCASKMLDNFFPPFDATLVARLQNAGCISLGKTNMDEFAMGSSNETSYYGPAKNPWDLTRVPGGSSGGSAAAVAAGLILAASGSDTGGSIRQPAALCGLTGLKPTYGRISRFGLIAYASSLDQGGFISRYAEDIAYLLAATAGFDPRDATSSKQPVPHYVEQLEQPVRKMKIGLVKEYIKSLPAHLEKPFEETIACLTELGCTFQEVSLPNVEYAIPTYYIIAPAECSSNLARYDGLKFGYCAEHPTDLQDLYYRTRGEGFGIEVKRRILLGTFVLSAGHHDAYYGKAQKMRQIIKDDYLKALSQVDCLLTPTTAETAFPLGEKTKDPLKMYLNDFCTLGINLAGLPAISFPIGLHAGLPISAQLIGAHFTEEKLLQLTHAFQQHTKWHRLAPKLS